MLKQKLMIAALTALSFMPLAATASTLDPSNTLVNGGSYNMLGSNFFGETFLTADGAGTRSFTFTNYNSVSANIELMVATVSALAEKFTGGVTFSWLSGGASLVVGQAMTNYVGALSHVIAAGTSDTLVVAFGNPEVRTCSRTGKKKVCGGRANFTVSLLASPVPLPASGLLLMGALGGLAALRRRKSV